MAMTSATKAAFIKRLFVSQQQRASSSMSSLVIGTSSSLPSLPVMSSFSLSAATAVVAMITVGGASFSQHNDDDNIVTLSVHCQGAANLLEAEKKNIDKNDTAATLDYIEDLRARGKEIKTRWELDEENWRKLPARAWPEIQPDMEDIPNLRKRKSRRFDLATALIFNSVDQKEGLDLYKQLADNKEGNSDAECALGICLIEGFGDADDEKGVEWLQKSASKEHIQAYYELGCLYYTGAAEPYIVENTEMAFKLFELAVKGDHTGAMFMLSELLITGDGCEQDFEKALPLLYRAAEKGHRFSRQMIREIIDRKHSIIKL